MDGSWHIYKPKVLWQKAERLAKAVIVTEEYVAVMRQYILAGIGNIYKSEVLFLCKVNPFANVSTYSDHDLKIIVYKARQLLRQNIQEKPRATRHALDQQRFWVYERSGRPCRRCGTNIRMRRQSFDGRSTYWCPNCQS